MVNKFERFESKYEELKKTAEAFQQANQGRRSPFVKQSAAELFTASAAQNYRDYLLNNRQVQSEELCAVLNLGAEQRDAIVTGLEVDLEGLVGDMNDQDVLIGLQIVPAKDSYHGDNARLYRKITDLNKRAVEMETAIRERNTDKMYDEVKEAERIRLRSINEGQKALCDALIDARGNFIQENYFQKYQETQGKFEDTLSGNEKGYLTANLEGVRFRDFYDTLQDIKRQNQRRQNQGNGNQNQGRNQGRR